MASILLSFLILLSSSGITYAQHYCAGREMLSKITLGEEPLSCGMALPVSDCGDENMETHFCCSDRYLKVDTDNQFAKISFDFNFDIRWVSFPVEVFVLPNVQLQGHPVTWYPCYRPPPLDRDLQIWHETFLI